LAAVAVWLILAGATPPTCALLRWRLLPAIGPVVFVLTTLEGMFVHRCTLPTSNESDGVDKRKVHARMNRNDGEFLILVWPGVSVDRVQHSRLAQSAWVILLVIVVVAAA